MRPDKLILVYNADSGRLNALKDSLRKAFGVSECALCDLTHGVAGERGAWKECKASLGIPVEYLHRDELDTRTRKIAEDLPCILTEADGKRFLLIGREEILTCSDLTLLQQRIGERLEELEDVGGG